MPETIEHPEEGTERAEFSGAKLNLGAEVGPEEVADNADFEDRTAAQLLAERHPEWPPIQLRIHFSSHTTSKDFRGVSEHLQDPDPAARPDIYLFEDQGGSPANVARWQEVADCKDASASDILRANPQFVGNTAETRLRGLLGTEIAVGNIDLRKENVDDAALDSAIKQSWGFVVYKGFERSLQETDRMAINVASLQRRREATMTQHLEPEIARLIEQRPELGTKDKLNIFLTLGSMHTTLFRDLKQAGFEIDRTFPETPYPYSYVGELHRTHQYGADARLNVDRKNELLARAFLEQVLMDERLESESYDDSVLVKRYICEQFGYDEIKAMHGELVQEPNTRFEILGEHLKAKGLADLPQDPAEVYELAVWLRAGLHRQAGIKEVSE